MSDLRTRARARNRTGIPLFLGLAATAALLAACGGGGGDSADASATPTTPNANTNTTPTPNASALSCNTANYTAGAVELPSAAQMAAFAGTYNGEEGRYGANPGDPFVKSADATLVLAADGTLTYKGVAYTASSVCVEKVASALGKLLYVEAGTGHFDIAELTDATLGNAWGVSPADGSTVFTKGLKP